VDYKLEVADCSHVHQDPGLSLPRLDTNPDRFWTFWMKRLDFGCEVPCVWTRSDIDRTHRSVIWTRLDGVVVNVYVTADHDSSSSNTVGCIFFLYPIFIFVSTYLC